VGGGELHAVYLRGTDGSPAIRLGDGIGFTFSPDGQWALGTVGNVSHGLTLLPCGAGEGRFLELQGLEVIYGTWFPDGMSICMLGHEPGKGARLFRVDPVTGKHEPFSEEGITSFDPLIAPDGRFVACQGPDRRLKIYPVDGGEPKLLPGVLPNERMIRWSEDGAAAYVFGRGELPAKIFKIDLATGERTLWKELAPPDPTGVEGITSIRMTPVGDAYGYSYAQRLNDLYVVEGLF
jgi:hypothetical protein